jgi:hypothetical protein
MTGEHAAEVLTRIDTEPSAVPAVHQPDKYLSVIERLATDKNVDIEKLQKIIDMKNREEDREAEQAFNADMVLAQAEIKTVVKNQYNNQTRSNYADLGAVIKASKPAYTKHGFSLSFYQGETPLERHIRVMVDVMHRNGHTKTRYYDVPLDNTGIAGKTNKTLVHGGGSSVSYGRRYLTCMIFNIPTGDDDDGQTAGDVEYITGEDLDHIKKLHEETMSDPKWNKKFMRLAEANSLDEIPVRNFEKVLNALNEAKVALKGVRVPGQEG